ncbi:VOC family protein [Bradyrhizobium glycinis]|uniref:VOC family protein n=1 Tax=Bradyrhizobium glycinis TaxID=2751812 RepID=UPI0018D6C397|nr:VOC family protein [Bradyrhizobium glycinis]MBH5369008.1 VOC family protein [Bradyrhizobium glycinis]
MRRDECQIPPALGGFTFHHLGLAVATPDEAFRYLGFLGYVAGPSAFDPLQRVNLAMRHHPTMPDVEIIWPGNGPSPIDSLIKKTGTMIYHVCYECSEAEGALNALSAAGIQIVEVSPPTPAVLFGGQEVSFHHVSGFGLIEILHKGSLSGRQETARER